VGETHERPCSLADRHPDPDYHHPLLPRRLLNAPPAARTAGARGGQVPEMRRALRHPTALPFFLDFFGGFAIFPVATLSLSTSVHRLSAQLFDLR
ncbi:MAG: hypothetical protein V4804_00520, partial [Pseudomonadota bacterium]